MQFSYKILPLKKPVSTPLWILRGHSPRVVDFSDTYRRAQPDDEELVRATAAWLMPLSPATYIPSGAPVCHVLRLSPHSTTCPASTSRLIQIHKEQYPIRRHGKCTPTSAWNSDHQSTWWSTMGVRRGGGLLAYLLLPVEYGGLARYFRYLTECNTVSAPG